MIRSVTPSDVLCAADIITPNGKAMVLGKTRVRSVYKLRRAAMVASRDFGWSLPHIGKTMGRDHTTIMHGVRQFEREADDLDRAYRNSLRRVASILASRRRVGTP